MLLAFLLVEDVIADPPKPAGDSVSNLETSAIDRAPAAEPSAPPPLAADKPGAAAAADRPAFDMFLDRLMRAESGGRDTAANPRSTALGPYQFIKSTFLDLARRHFGIEVQELSEDEILRLRTAHFCAPLRGNLLAGKSGLSRRAGSCADLWPLASGVSGRALCCGPRAARRAGNPGGGCSGASRGPRQSLYGAHEHQQSDRQDRARCGRNRKRGRRRPARAGGRRAAGSGRRTAPCVAGAECTARLQS